MVHEGTLRIRQIAKTVYVMEEFVGGTWRRMDNTTMTFEQAKTKSNEQTMTVVDANEKVLWPKAPEPEAAPVKPKGKKKDKTG